MKSVRNSGSERFKVEESFKICSCILAQFLNEREHFESE